MRTSLFTKLYIKNAGAAFAVVVMTLVISANQAVAGNVLWNKTTGDWQLTGTWNGGNLPTSTDDVRLETGSTTYVRALTNGVATPAYAKNLQLEPGAKLIIEPGASLTISTSITFDASTTANPTTIVELNGSLTIINSVSSANRIIGEGPTRFFKTGLNGALIIDNIGSTAVKFPVGTADNSYTPVSILATSGSGKFSVGVKDKVYKNTVSGTLITNGIIDKTWNVSKLSTVPATVSLTFSWNAGDVLGSFSGVDAAVANYHNGYWNFPGVSETIAGDKSVTRKNVSSFSPFAVYDAGINPLPVSLTYFKAAKTENGTALTWETASEKNNKGYDVQASADGKNFETVAFVASKNGNANYSQRYEFLDKTSRSGLVYYRLKQTDFDGTVAYYAAKVVDLGKFSEGAVAYPNPFQNQFEVKLNGASTVEVTDLTGKVIFKNQVSDKGINALSIDMTNQPAGVYLLKATASGSHTITRIVKQ